MTTFDDREDLFEKRFAHDEALQFKADARHAKLFGLWIAEQMGMYGADAENYAQEVVVSSLQEEGDEDILKRVVPDIKTMGLDIPEADLRARLDEFLEIAKQQVMAEAD